MNTTPPAETASHPQWTIEAAPVTDPDAVAALRLYVEELTRRFHGRPVTASEVDEVMAVQPVDDLTPPRGVLLLARRDGDAVAGCVGVRLLEPGVAELKRMFVHPDTRGSGLASRLVEAAERAARDELDAGVMRLDTRSDLAEARALYARLGYAEIPRYNDSPYAQHWFEKRLATN